MDFLATHMEKTPKSRTKVWGHKRVLIVKGFPWNQQDQNICPDQFAEIAGKFIKLPIDMRRIAENREAVNPGCPAATRVFIGTILVGMQIYFKNISVAFIYHRCCTTVLRHVWEKNILPLLLERSSQLDCEITNDGKLSTGKAQISLRQENSFQSCIFWDIF